MNELESLKEQLAQERRKYTYYYRRHLTIYNEVVDGSPTDSKKAYPTVSWDSAALVDEFFKRVIYCDEGLYAAITGAVTEVFLYVIEE